MGNFFVQVWRNPLFLPAITAWFTAQFLKTMIQWRISRKLSWERMVGSGGMPSAHTALVMCVTTMVGLVEGFTSLMFGVSVMFSFIVMYDASGVRLETGKQAKLLNELMEHIYADDEIDFTILKELIGHKPIEVFAGAILGGTVAVLWHYLI